MGERSSSLGEKRASSLMARWAQSWKGKLVRTISPVDRSPRHNPAPSFSSTHRAARKLFSPSARKFSSKRVPGVTTRMICRSTRPLALSGGSVCSHIATL